MKNEQKKRELPNTIVIILLIILAACIMTWIIPAGEYVRVKNEAGTSVIDPNQFSFVARTPVNPLTIPNHIAKGFKDGVAVYCIFWRSISLCECQWGAAVGNCKGRKEIFQYDMGPDSVTYQYFHIDLHSEGSKHIYTVCPNSCGDRPGDGT